jgi:hypothetical protein
LVKARKARKEANAPVKEKSKAGVYEIPGQVSLERSPFRLRGTIKYISTDIDRLYSYILEHKRVKLSTAVKKFNAKKELIEEWGSILEDHHMIEMHYPLAGEPTLRIPTPERKRDKKAGKEKKPKKKGKPLHLKFTKKRLLIMAETIVLGEILIYIFLVNPHLRDNFLPTLNYQLTNLPANIMNLPSYISGLNMSINPIYFFIGIMIVIFWMAITLHRKKKRPGKAKGTA